MKKLFTGILFILSIATENIAQISIENIPPKANRIELITGLSFEENFSLVGKKLVENGFILDQVQKDFGYITTNSKDLSKMNLTLKLKFIIEEKKVILSGDYNLRGLDSVFDVIQNRGMKGSPMKVAFEEFLKIALKIPYSEINFTVFTD